MMQVGRKPVMAYSPALKYTQEEENNADDDVESNGGMHNVLEPHVSRVFDKAVVKAAQ